MAAACVVLLLAAVLAASVAELGLRFRRARGVERLQLTWLVWAVASQTIEPRSVSLWLRPPPAGAIPARRRP
jgi:hypothetical protein